MESSNSLTDSVNAIILFVKYYINIQYYLGICSFKVVRKISVVGNVKQTHYVYQRWWPPVILTILLTFSFVAFML